MGVEVDGGVVELGVRAWLRQGYKMELSMDYRVNGRIEG